MAVLGALICEILELEIVHLLKKDTSISKICVVDSEASQGFIKALEENHLDHFIVTESFDDFLLSKSRDLILLVHVLELGLHSSKIKLQEALVAETLKIESFVDALFIGYCLCGNALADPETLLSRLKVPFFLPQEKDHLADDCVGLLIGGRKAYYEEQLKEAGTFFMTSGWTNHWKTLIEKDFGNMGIKMAQRMFRNYKRALLISTPVMPTCQMQENIREFNHLFDCYSETSKGSMDILNNAWQKAKASTLK